MPCLRKLDCCLRIEIHLISRSSKIIIIVIGVFTLLVGGGLYFIGLFFSAFAPPKVTVTKEFISTNRDFINGVTIEKIKVDSMGDSNYPIEYTVFYRTSCNIQHPPGKPPEPPSKIEFYKPGKYSWDEDTVHVRYIHMGLGRQSLDTSGKAWWLNKFGDHPVCPIKFEPGQWYFITIGDPKLTGIFFYIDKNNRVHQFDVESGVSPI